MEHNSDKDLIRARQLLYFFNRSFFDSTPTQEKLDLWISLLRSLGKGTGNPELDERLHVLYDCLNKSDLLTIQNEYYELFENPFGQYRIITFASYYIDGRIMGESLVNLRQLLYNINIGKVEGFKETEDSLVFLLDVMTHLIEKGDDQEGLANQAQLLFNYIIPCVKGMLERIEGLGDFRVYKAVMREMEAHCSLEGSLFPHH